MFKLAANPTFSHVVRVQVPIDGGHREETFRARFRVLATERAAEFDLRSEAGVREFLVAAVEHLDEITDERGHALPYSDELRDRAIGVPYVRQALLTAYLKGVAGAAAGN